MNIFAKIAKEEMRTHKKPSSKFGTKVQPLMTYLVNFIDHMRRLGIGKNLVQSLVERGEKEKFLEMWMGKSLVNFLNILDLASRYVDKGYFVKSRVLADFSELVQNKILSFKRLYN